MEQYDLLPVEILSGPVFVGIDPGKEGAIGFVDSDGRNPRVVAIPMLPDKKSYDFDGIVALLFPKRGLDLIGAAVERLPPMPATMGGAFANYGRGESLAWEWLFRSKMVPVVRPVPVQWQKRAFLGSAGADSKTRSLLEAQRRWPGIDLRRTQRSRNLDNNFSDALHLACFARDHFCGSL